jgi:hypothetical protein
VEERTSDELAAGVAEGALVGSTVAADVGVVSALEVEQAASSVSKRIAVIVSAIHFWIFFTIFS